MPDNLDVTPGTGATVAADLIAGVLYQRIKPTFGADGSATDVSASNPLPVDGSGVTQPVSAASLPLPTSAATSTKQSDGSQKTQVVDGSGNVIASTSNALNVAVASGGPTQVTEDAAAAADPVGNMTMAVRRDTLTAAEVSADGDVVAIKATNKGQMHVKLADTVTVDGSGVTQPISAASLPLPSGAATAAKQPALGTAGSAASDVITVQGIASMTALKTDSSATTQPVSGTVAVSGVTAGVSATSLGKAEDAAHASGDTGVMGLAVRNDTAAALAGTNGDYIPQTTNARGAMWIAIEDGAGGQVTSFSGGTQYTEDAAAASDPVGPVIMGIRRDTLNTSEVSADGDNVAIKATNKGQLHTSAVVTDVVPGTAATNLGKAEDAAHASGDTGVMMLTVRKDTAAATSGTDGDYQPPITDANGRLHVNIGAGGITSGTAGSASSDVVTVQGASGMTAVQVAGDVAHDAVDANSPQKIGGYAKAAAPTDVSADGDRVNAWFVRNGAQAVTLTAGGAIITGDATNGLDIDLTRIAFGAVQSGAFASGALASGSIAAGAVAAGPSSFVKLEDAASADGDAGVPAMMRRTLAPANTSGTDLDYEMLQGSGGYLWVHDNKGLSNLAFSAAFTTLTRPANTTAYTAGDSISDNATAGSVIALSATVSDVNDDPIFISEIVVSSTDTGLAGKKLRAYLFNSDPTASTGVGAGDNAAYSQKKAGYIGSFQGWMETGFSDGTVGRLVPTYNETNNSPAGGFVVAKPTSGARTLYIQYQAVEAFTPSANSTTIIGTAKGWQGRAV